MKKHLAYYRRKYQIHRGNAIRRGKEFLLTFEEWLQIWLESGQLDNRGNKKGQYAMARYGDKGPYAVGNVKIISVEQNLAEQWARPETRKKIRKANLGNQRALGYKHSEEAKQQMSANRKGKNIGNKWNIGRKASIETRQKLSEVGKRTWAKRAPEERQKLSKVFERAWIVRNGFEKATVTPASKN